MPSGYFLYPAVVLSASVDAVSVNPITSVLDIGLTILCLKSIDIL